ncbi:MAG: NAD(P)-dependent oxidoreductase [Gemmatimonadota bacterium]
MKALLTGATGFVGRHLVSTLLRRGDDVTALIRSPQKAQDIADTGVRLITGDLDDQRAMAQAAEGQDVVYHVAGLTAALSEAEFLHVNRDGTQALLAAATVAGCRRFVLVSSAAAAGPSQPGVPSTGDEPPHPVTIYGESKLAGERVVRASSIPWTIVRPPAVYGPGDRELLRIFKLARLGIAPVFGGGRQELSLVYGPDLGEALAAAGHAPAAVGKVYYACHPEVVTSGMMVREIGRAMGKSVRLLPLPGFLANGILTVTGAAARLTGKATLLTRDKAHEFLAPAWTADPSRLTADTGWRAEHDLRSGVSETLEWYRSHKWL